MNGRRVSKHVEYYNGERDGIGGHVGEAERKGEGEGDLLVLPEIWAKFGLLSMRGPITPALSQKMIFTLLLSPAPPAPATPRSPSLVFISFFGYGHAGS